MLRFKHYIEENSIIGIHGEIPKTLEQFLHHLSSPISHHPDTLNEVTVYDHKDSKLAGKMAAGKLTRSAGLIAQGTAEFGNENIFSRVMEGLRKANEHIGEHPELHKGRVKVAKEVYKRFAESRGFKTTPELLNQNGKTEKSTGEGVLTVGLSLAPHTTAGLSHFDVCPRASKECRANCLGTEAGGNKQYPDSALASKILKTHFMAAHPEEFGTLLHHELKSHERSAARQGLIPGARLNVTSDISFEHVMPNLFHAHPGIQFYDYTKMHNRVLNQTKPTFPKNYHLTLSHTGTGHEESNDKHVVDVLRKGGVVASVYHRGKSTPVPTHMENAQTGERWPVAGGDDDDNTFDRHTTLGREHLKPGHGVVSGLMLKGVSNEDAGHFANKVDPDGIIRINKGK